MSFMDDVLKQNTPIWDTCADTPFVQKLWDGTLPLEKFKRYIVQDSIYLKHYARVYGKAIYHSTRLKDIQLYYSILNFVTDKESLVRLRYLEQFGITDDEIELEKPLPENQNYIDFLMDIAERGNSCEILMAVLPCMASYSYIFRKIAAAPGSPHTRYSDFIQDYADERYFADCKRWCGFADEKCAPQSAIQQAELRRIFEKASYLELDFWQMAGRA